MVYNESFYIQGRRTFIRDMSLSGMALLTGSLLLGGCEDILDKIQHRPTRRMIRNNAEANHMIDIYRNGVSLMKGLPASDKRNWDYQASLHTNFCPHGSPFFFPWHRIYLFYFEQIIRKLTNEPTFGLPYWNWCVTRNVPDVFYPPPSPNALDHGRGVSAADPIAAWTDTDLATINTMLDTTDFVNFAGDISTGAGGLFEGPHGNIHGWVGGDMGSVPTAAYDPLFWVHHCFVDLAWFEWNITRGHPNTSDPSWAQHDFSGMFVDADGNPASMTSIASVLLPLLSYQYETGIAGSNTIELQALKNKAAFEKLQETVKKGAPVSLNIQKRFPLQRGIAFNLNQPVINDIPVSFKDFESVFSNDISERVLLSVKKIMKPPAQGIFLRIFINKPDANNTTPITDSSYAGSFYFFGNGSKENMQNHSHMQTDLLVDITDTLKRLQQAGKWNTIDKISITMIGISIEGIKVPQVSFSAEGIELAISKLNLEKMKF